VISLELMRRRTNWAVAMVLITVPLGVLAGSLRVSPIRVEFDDQSAAAILTLMNEGQDKATVQLNAMSWYQDPNGVDSYTETKDIVFFPKILEVDPATERIIRVGFQGESTPAVEGTYRIFLQELPVAKPGDAAITFAMTFSIPIFVAPKVEERKVTIDEVIQKNGHVRIKIWNGGNTHIVVNEVQLQGFDVAGHEVFSNKVRGWYLLANKSRIHELSTPNPGCSQAATIDVTVQVGRETLTTTLDADPSQCNSNEKTTRQATSQAR
jgi:fimbrial chaperone protein